ncbi:zinc finger and SCAN domain-containing protein 31-like [Cyclopterus lumpus]|uniref:C2H2-type domain-containing protein n=1 Tax=Cyclopterus lumpus TaxID=8103 RepID=A0A8C3G9B5_CYCLU|nr:zinc finger and SCAN domain-containing protein 31-like [Cyclopterus lumpus]
MSSVENMRKCFLERLTAAAEEIFGVFEKTIFEYQEEVDRQRRLLDIVRKPVIKLHRTELPEQHGPTRDHQLLSYMSHVAESPDQKGSEHDDSESTSNAEPQPKKRHRKNRSRCDDENLLQIHNNTQTEQHVCKEEEVLCEQQLCIQERSSSLDQEDPEPPQIKEEQEELCTSQEGEQLELKQETETFMLTPTCEETDHSEPEPPRDHQLLSDISHVAESPHQKGSKHEDSESTSNAEPQPKKRHRKNRGHCDDKNSLKTRNNTQTGKAPFRCNTCGKAFKLWFGLYTHLRNPEGGRPHACKYCGKGFSKTSTLTSHLRIHLAKKPFFCKTCEKDFRCRSIFTVHMRTHR